MTQIQKKQLFNINFFLPPVLIILHIITVIYLFKKVFIFVFLIYSFAILAFLLVYLNYKRKINLLTIKRQDLLEKSNLLIESIQKEKLLSFSLDKKNSRYVLLKDALDKFNQSLVLGQAGRIIAEEVYRLFSGIGSVIIYLINQENNQLEILSAKKINSDEIIKEKQGDLFDEWVLRHNQPLLVEDTNKDFRFDPEQIKARVSRQLGSLIIAPLITSHKFLGLLRVESSKPLNFFPEDLRFLSTIANLAGISIENSLLYEQTQQLAIKDGLTGLYLRRFLDERGREEIQYALRQNTELSILMIDIDFFKNCNDKFGHRLGDIVLANIADLLKGIFHDKNYTICRFGGEEFVVLLPMIGKDKALDIAEDFRKSIYDGVILFRRIPIKITVSIGVAAYPLDAKSWVDLIREVDVALYKAKQEGRNRVCCR